MTGLEVGDGWEMGGIHPLVIVDVNHYLNLVLQSCTHTMSDWLRGGRWMGDGGGVIHPSHNCRCEPLLKSCLTILTLVLRVQVFFNDNDKLVTNDKMMG